MNILLINHFPLTGSGSGTYTRNLAVHLAERGHGVCIIFPENTAEVPEIPGVKLHPVFFAADANAAPSTAANCSQADGLSPNRPLPFNFPCFTTHPRSLMTFGDLTNEQLAQYTEAFSAAIAEEVKEFSPDVIHGQHVWILSSLAADFDVPLVLTAHGTDLMGYQKWPHLRSYADRALETCSAVITISKDSQELLLRQSPQHAAKFKMMRNGFDPHVFHEQDVSRAKILAAYHIAPKSSAQPVVMFAGKLTHFKGVDVLLNAAAQYEQAIQEECGSIPLTLLAGDGEDRAALLKQAETLGLTSVFFLGNVNQQELCKLYNIADLSVVPSRREPFGLVAIEAMACGIPVIASNEGGLPDFVNDKVGALVEPENPTKLAEAVRQTLARVSEDTSRDWRHSIASYAREHYAQDKIISELEDLYRHAAEAHA